MSSYEVTRIADSTKTIINPATLEGQVDVEEAIGLTTSAIGLLAKLTDTQPVSVNSLPLPTGAATAANQALALAAIAKGADFYLQVALGFVPGYSLVHKFGASNLTTTLQPICVAQTYQTPLAAVSLEFVSSSVADAQNGIGARKITFIGLDENWLEIIQEVSTHATTGTTAVVIPIPLTRLYRWYVSESGSYANPTTGSHQGTLTVRVAGAGATWAQITTTPTATGQSQTGVYTIPKGKKAFLLSKHVFTDTTKSADIYFFFRANADDVTTPYTGVRRLVQREVGVTGGEVIKTRSPKGAFIGPCDIGFMGKVSVGTAEASVEFELLLIDTI